jgi:hypothetical protein
MNWAQRKRRKIMANHHPDREGLPSWVLDLGNQIFHKTCTVVQGMLPTEENVTIIHNLIMALEWEYLIKRAVLDVGEGLCMNTVAVRKALRERFDRENAK